MRTTMPDDLTITTRRRIDDAGEKIGGARKDAWAQRGLATSDLAEMTPEEARQHVTKDAIWPKPDWSAMVADGLDPTAEALTTGRASRRERVCTYVTLSVGAVSLKKK